MRACYKNDLKRAYLILEGVEGEAEDYQIYMLKENDISGLLKTDIRYVDNISQYYYDISGKVSLKAMHEKVKINLEEMKSLIHALLRTIKVIRKYMLEGNCILLDPEYIFYEKEQFYFCYFPQCTSLLKEEFHKLTEYFIKEADYKDSEGVYLAYSLHKATMEENYSIERLMNEFVYEYEDEEEDSIVNYQEKMEETEDMGMIQEKREFWEPVRRLLERKRQGKWKY